MYLSGLFAPKRRLFALWVVVAVALSACNTGSEPDAVSADDEIYVDTEVIQEELLYTTSPSRSGAKPLDGERITGRIYIHLADTANVSEIQYHLDNVPRTDSPFVKVSPDERPAITTTVLPDRTHTLTAAVIYQNGSVKAFTSTFLVDNGGTYGDKLLVSEYTDRGFSKFLDGRTIPGKSYVFVIPKEPVERIEFYLDDPGRTGSPRQTENYVFYDMGGTAHEGEAWPINKKALSQGSHTVTAVIYRRSGEVRTTEARFTVSDSSAAPAPAPEPTPAPTPTPDYGPVQNPNIPSGATYISPGQSINSVINSRPKGSTFVLRAGVHRGQSIVLSENSTLIGEYGAVLSGAKEVTSFSNSNGYWVLSGQNQEARPYDGEPAARRCLDGYPACRRSEQVFINNTSLKQVSSLSELSSGEFYFDYGADRIYLRDDPRGKKVEVSYTEKALIAERGSTVRNLVIEKYNTSSLYASVTARDNTTFERNEIRYNGGAGITVSDDVVLKGNKISHNTRLGLHGYTSEDTLVEDNEIAYNNTSGHYYNHEAGGVKFIKSRDLRIRGNYTHHNLGAGIWSDIGNSNILYENNVVTDNLGNGIFHELGYAGEIRYNIIERNNRGISVNNSSDVKVHHNTLRDNVSSLYANNLCRYEAETYKSRNTTFYNNTVYQKAHVGPTSEWPKGKAAAFHVPSNCQYWNFPSSDFYEKMGNRWYSNTYYLSGAGSNTRSFFFWKDQERSYSEWKSFGQN